MNYDAILEGVLDVDGTLTTVSICFNRQRGETINDAAKRVASKYNFTTYVWRDYEC